MPVEVSQRLCSPIVSVVYCWATALYEQTARRVKAFHDREGQREMEKDATTGFQVLSTWLGPWTQLR